MALYVILRHRGAPRQAWSNTWQDDDVITGISTTEEIARFCKKAKARGERVYVHRCQWKGYPATISCSVKVKAVAQEDGKTWSVSFGDPEVLSVRAWTMPTKGQNCYKDPPPSEADGARIHSSPK